jgi:hypothetical protein
MLQVISGSAAVNFRASINVGVYLDSWAVFDLAEQDASRRARFISLLRSGLLDVMFSVTTAAEMSGPEGPGRKTVRAFLDEIGPHWFPVALNVMEAVKREKNGARFPETCVDTGFVKSYLSHPDVDRALNPTGIVNLSTENLRLGPVLDWVGPQRASILKGSQAFDQMLLEKVAKCRSLADNNPTFLDTTFPALPFDPSMPATFMFNGLMRNLILEAKTCPPTKNDGLDFCHAIMGGAYAHFTTLDKRWKRRVNGFGSRIASHLSITRGNWTF